MNSVSVSRQRAKPVISPVRNAGIYTHRIHNSAVGHSVLIHWVCRLFLTYPHSLNPRWESNSSGILVRQTVWPFISAMTLMAGVGFVAAVVLPNRFCGKWLRKMSKT